MISVYRKTNHTNQISQENTLRQGSWINIINPTKEETKKAVEKFKLPLDFIQAALDEDERPRIDKENHTLLFIIRVAIKEEKTYKVIPLGIILTKDFVFTICRQETDVINDFIANKIKTFCTTKKVRFLLQIIKNTNKYYDRYVDEIDKLVNLTEKKLLYSHQNEEVIKFLELQKVMVYFNTAVVSNDKVFNKMIKSNLINIYEEDKELLEDLIVENKEVIETLAIFSNILANTMDAYASIVSNNLNVVMKFLTSFTIILSVPTIIASLYGMNVQLPFQTYPWAFWFTIFVSALLMLILVVIFNKKKYF